MTTKITTTPSPLEVVDKINAVIDDATNLSTTVVNKLDKTGKAADAVKADTATTISTTLPIDKGGTNATTAENARTNLGLATAFTAASISGKVITLTKANGTTTTLTTQDTVNTGATTKKLDTTITVTMGSTKTVTVSSLTVAKPIFITYDVTTNTATKLIYVTNVATSPGTTREIASSSTGWISEWTSHVFVATATTSVLTFENNSSRGDASVKVSVYQ